MRFLSRASPFEENRPAELSIEHQLMKKAWNPPFIHGGCRNPGLCDVIEARTKPGEQRDERMPTDGGNKGSKTPPRQWNVRKTNSRTEIALLQVTNIVQWSINSIKSADVVTWIKGGGESRWPQRDGRQRDQRVPKPTSKRSKGADTASKGADTEIGNKQDQETS